jgi:hypothetical protein
MFTSKGIQKSIKRIKRNAKWCKLTIFSKKEEQKKQKHDSVSKNMCKV